MPALNSSPVLWRWLWRVKEFPGYWSRGQIVAPSAIYGSRGW